MDENVNHRIDFPALSIATTQTAANGPAICRRLQIVPSVEMNSVNEK
jgi:hypothetical protein